MSGPTPPRPAGLSEDPESAEPGPGTPARWQAGTLRYTRRGLYVLFFWLMWNDLCLMLMENLGPTLTPVLFRDAGATNTQIAFWTATLTPLLGMWINPIISTYSDRFRSRFGRRRPFLLVATPFCALFLAALPWAGKLATGAAHVPLLARALAASPTHGAVLFLGLVYLVYSLFNTVILALFTYYWWDVVPLAVLGRFNALVRIVTLSQTFIWNYYLFGLADHHMAALYGGLAAFFLVVYVVSVWRVKEGNYPPPEPLPRQDRLAGVKTYWRECFTERRYLWVYLGFALYQMGNLANIYRIFHWHEQLGMDFATIGRMQSWPQLAVIALAFPLGALIDRLTAIRVIAPSLLFWAACNAASYFFLRGPHSLLVCMGAVTLANFIFNICQNVVTVELFPRTQLGQFCSANAITAQVIGFAAALVLGQLFDRWHNYQYVYAWVGACQVLAALVFVKVYFDWQRTRRTAAAADPA